MDWTGWIGLDPAEKPSPLRAPAVLKIEKKTGKFGLKKGNWG